MAGAKSFFLFSVTSPLYVLSPSLGFCLNIQTPFSPEAMQHKLGLHVVAEPARKADFSEEVVSSQIIKHLD